MRSLSLCSACYLYAKTVQFHRGSNSFINFFKRSIVTQKEFVVNTDEVSEVLETKVIYNSRIHYVYNRGRIQSETSSPRKISDVPVALKLLGLTENTPVKQKETDVTDATSNSNTDNNDSPNLPFKYYYSPIINKDQVPDETDEEHIDQQFYTQHEIRKSRKWMTDYEFYQIKTVENEEEIDAVSMNYGTPNKLIPISKVPCGGCGARMQCQEPSIPGYLPSEIFLECNEDDLKGLLCQRCHFMKNYNTALSVQVDPAGYAELLSEMKENSLVILLVDLTDFPCSIWPGIINVVGKRRPIFVVGNKVDLLWGDRKNWLKHVEEVLRNQFPSNANILDVSLISAKTGYGVENLITKLQTIWKYSGNVYVIGCTNVGKSTLFNALLSSDYCKSKAVDLIQRATTAPWPKTTLNLLKFPILRPEGWKLYLRDKRLSLERQRDKAEAELRKIQFSKNKKNAQPMTLIGHIAHTFRASLSKKKDDDQFSLSKAANDHMKVPSSVLDSDFPEYRKSHWFYDTPGVLHEDQILDLLTTEELIKTIPTTLINPKSYRVLPGWSIFIGGLARLDFTKGQSAIRITIFSSDNLPVTICATNDADDVYATLLKSKYFEVPSDGEIRLKQWPGLSSGKEFSVSGVNENESCADVVLSSAGWIALTPPEKHICKFIAWTPLARGIHVRHPPLLPFAVSLRGTKMRHTPDYRRTRPYIPA